MTLRSYRLERQLGAGGSGEVWLAKGPRGKRVALKARLRQQGVNERPFRQEFERLRTLRVPSIIRVFETGADQGYVFFTMELATGRPFNLHVQDGSDLAERVRRLCAAGTEVARALAGVHRLGLAHRDIKPTNILVTEQGHATVLDFGTSRFGAAEDAAMLGTLGYMAPEQRVGMPHDQQVDIYALGVTLHEALTGSSSNQARPGRPRSALAALGPDVPLALSALVDDMLRLDPTERPAAEDVEATLQAIAQGASPSAPWPEPRVYTGDASPLLAESAMVIGRAGTGRQRMVQEARWSWFQKGYRSFAGTCRPDHPFSAFREILQALFSGLSPGQRRTLAGSAAPMVQTVWPDTPLPVTRPEPWPPDPLKAGRVLAELFERASPVALVFWDLDRADPGTTALLAAMARRVSSSVRIWATGEQPAAGLALVPPPKWTAEQDQALVSDLLGVLTPPPGPPGETPLASCARAWRELARARNQRAPLLRPSPGLAALSVLEQPFPTAVAERITGEVPWLLSAAHLRSSRDPDTETTTEPTKTETTTQELTLEEVTTTQSATDPTGAPTQVHARDADTEILSSTLDTETEILSSTLNAETEILATTLNAETEILPATLSAETEILSGTPHAETRTLEDGPDATTRLHEDIFQQPTELLSQTRHSVQTGSGPTGTQRVVKGPTPRPRTAPVQSERSPLATVRFADPGTHRISRARVTDRAGTHAKATEAWRACVGIPSAPLAVAHHALLAGTATAKEFDDAISYELDRDKPAEVARWLRLRDLHLNSPDDFATAYARLYSRLELNPSTVESGSLKRLRERASTAAQQGMVAYLQLIVEARHGDRRRAIATGHQWAHSLSRTSPVIAAYMLREVALARLRMGELPLAVVDGRRALTLAHHAARLRTRTESPPLTQAEVNAGTTLSAALIYSGRLAEAALFCDNLAGRCAEADMPRGEAALRTNLAIVQHAQGRRPEATQSAARARALQPRHRDPVVLANCALIQGRLAVEAGQVHAARPLLDEALTTAQALRHGRLQANCWSLSLEAALQEADIVEGRRAITEYERATVDDQDNWPAVHARWRWLIGDLSGALQLTEAPREGHGGLCVSAERARLLLVSGRYDEAQQLARKVDARALRLDAQEISVFARLVAGAAVGAPDKEMRSLVAHTRHSRWVHLYLGALHLDAIRRQLRGEHVAPLIRQLRARSQDIGHKLYSALARPEAW